MHERPVSEFPTQRLHAVLDTLFGLVMFTVIAAVIVAPWAALVYYLQNGSL